VDIYCTRPTCAKPANSFADLDAGNTVKTINQKFCTYCGMPLILAGRYLTEKPLARGGFGATFTARDRYTPAMRRCVVKQLLPTGLTPSQMQIAQQMFDREGEVLETLGTHPQIPDLLAFFEVEAGKDKFFYLVQEFIDGFTLEQVVEQNGAIAEPDVLEIMTSLLPVLQFVHDNGSIHRDIKPSNIMIRKQDQKYFLLDFGAVKQIASAPVGQRSTGIFTPGYGAPEQMRGDKVFPASDLYAFGVTCIYLLTGKPPEDLFDAHTNTWAWRQFAPAVSDRLANILDRMMSAAPSDRYDSAQAVLNALGASNIVSSPVSRTPSVQAVQAIQPVQPVATPAPIKSPVQQPQTPVHTPPVPSQPLVLPPLGNQLFAAFLIGFEIAMFGIASVTVGATLNAPIAVLIVGAVVVLGALWLRITRVMDNKDLLFFVNGITFVALIAGFFFLKLAIPFNVPLPVIAAIAVLGILAGFSAVAITTLFRLIYQIIYSML
jgi:serine/threonine protein kinase